MDVNKAYAQDVRKVDDHDYGRIYNSLSRKWGDATVFPFAKFWPASDNSYVWSDPLNRDGWKPVSSSSSLKMEAINGALPSLSEKARELLGDDNATFMLTYPDEGYLFYRETDGGDIELLVTGWGFRSLPRPPVNINRGSQVQRNQRRRAFVSFIRNGEAVPHFRFAVRLHTMEKPFETDDCGTYCFEDVRPGEHFVLIALDSKVEFDLNVKEGVENYEFVIASPAEPDPPGDVNPPELKPPGDVDPPKSEPPGDVNPPEPEPPVNKYRCMGWMALLLVLLMLVTFLFVLLCLVGWLAPVTLGMSALSYILFGLDKRSAGCGKWRFPEWLLLATSALFGATGSLCAMLLFWHKVRKPRFWIVVGLSFLLHWLLIAWQYSYYLCY